MAPPRLGVGVLPAKAAADAFPPVNKGGRGGAAARSCSCQSRAGGLTYPVRRPPVDLPACPQHRVGGGLIPAQEALRQPGVCRGR